MQAAAFCHSTVVVFVVVVVALLWLALFAFAFAFFTACHTVLLLNAVATYVCVCGRPLAASYANIFMWLRAAAYLFKILQFTSPRQPGRQARQAVKTVPRPGPVSSAYRGHSHTHTPHPLRLYPPTGMTNNF